jgi:RNA polymerase subunit RPABC4/transcription elongation factor Spt4
MFCRKCGHKLNDDARFCPKCGTEVLKNSDGALSVTDHASANIDPGDQKQNKKRAALGAKNNKHPKHKFKILLVIAFVCLLFLGIQAARFYLGLNFMGIDEHEAEIGITEDGSQNVVYELKPEYVRQDEKTGINYVSNIIIVNFTKGTSQESIQVIADMIDGKIVGSIPSIYQYQIEVAEGSYDELLELCKTIETQECVRSAYPDLAVQLEDETIPDDPWGIFGEKWSEDNPSGNNWWIEAINAPSAWDYNDYFESINIGIVDSGFDVKHKDLNGVIKSVSKYNDASGHGTHVAGIIGAHDNNKIGITGVVWNAQIYTHDWELTKKQAKKVEKETGKDWKTYTEIYAGIEELVVNKKCKVINMSLGVVPDTNLMTDDFVNASAKSSSEFMIGLLEDNDFIIVQSAGNGDSNLKPINTKYNGHFCSISRDNCSSSDRISVDDVLDRIIIVGAAKNNGNKDFSCASFSNYGENVDIWAPGESIYSTYPMTGYHKMDGTSMAAPVVTGVAALVWETDISLTGNQVKDIVCDNSSKKYIVYGNGSRDSYTIDKYGMVNAQLAVEKALSNKKNKADKNDGITNELREQVADTEDNLVAVLSAECSDTLMVIIRDDFDGDGVYEAFAATSKDPNAVYYNDPDNYYDCYDDYTIWYVTYESATPVEDVPFGPNFVRMSSGTFRDGTKAVIVDSFMSNVDTDSYIFTLHGGTYKYLGTHTSSGISEDGLLYSGHFIRGMNSNYFETEIYEYSNGELIFKEKIKEDA